MENRPERYSREFISYIEQEKIQRSKILIAGCGAGSAVVPYLARLGFAKKGELVLADPDNVEISNLTRQPYAEFQIGLNKAKALSEEIQRVDSSVNTRSVPEGITIENVEQEVINSDLVIEMIDIGKPDLTFLVHSYAQKHKKPLVTGLDVGEGIIAYAFDYRVPSQLSYKEFLGLMPGVTSEQVAQLSPLGIASQFILGEKPAQIDTLDNAKDYYLNLPIRESERILEKLPKEMHEVFQALITGELNYIPQSGVSAGLLGAVLATQAKQLILGNPIKVAPSSVNINLLESIKQ